MEGGAIVFFSSLYFTHPCNIFWWISVLYPLQHCTLKRIHIKDRNVCIC